MARRFIRTGKFPSWFILVAIFAGVIAAWRVTAQQPNILDAVRSDTSPKRERGNVPSLALRACVDSSRVQDYASAIRDSASDAVATLKYQGATSCAAAACHNGDAFKGTKGTEYATWMNQDKKHARAFAVLT